MLAGPHTATCTTTESYQQQRIRLSYKTTRRLYVENTRRVGMYVTMWWRLRTIQSDEEREDQSTPALGALPIVHRCKLTRYLLIIIVTNSS